MALDVPPGQTVFLDSTILHYAFVDFPGATPQCIELLRRASAGELAACITVPVVNDASNGRGGDGGGAGKARAGRDLRDRH